MCAALLREIYYNAEHPASFGGVNKLVEASGLPRKQVQDWLKTQWTYTLHRPRKNKFDRRSYITRGLDFQWQADLVEMQQYSRQNKGMRYILTVIDIFSRYAFARPLPNKTPKEIVKAFKSIFNSEKRVPKLIQTDQGTEFENRIVRNYLANVHNVELFSIKSPLKAAIIERWNRTAKERMWRAFTRQGNRRWLELLPKIVRSYNNSKHRILGQTPASVTKDNEARVWLHLYASKPEAPRKKNKFKLGDRVRISRQKDFFEKGYTPNWTEEEFIIHAVNEKYRPTTYQIRSLAGELITGSFYEQELQAVTNTDEMYRIERVIRTRGRAEHKQALVKWMGYPEPTWIPYAQIQRVDNVVEH